MSNSSLKLNRSNSPLENTDLASYQYKILRKALLEFQESIHSDEEVAIQLSSYGQDMLLHVSDISYSDPFLLRFYGTLSDGSEIELIQHISQLNFYLVARKKLHPEKSARRIRQIGFRVAPEETDL